LQPDLILLDIGLPRLNGFAAARQIRRVSPQSKIIFVSHESSLDAMQEALDVGARSFEAKIDIGADLLAAVDAVLDGKQFVSSALSRQGVTMQALPVSAD
jgi:DNA-binding NarL/FixJ family response regulator